MGTARCNHRLAAVGVVDLSGLDEMLPRTEIVVIALFIRLVDTAGSAVKDFDCILASRLGLLAVYSFMDPGLGTRSNSLNPYLHGYRFACSCEKRR